MSNYTSQPITLAPVTTSINLPLIQQVLQVKQGTYNQADAQVQAGSSSLENLKLLRPQDTEYLNSKIRGMTASLDNMQDKDLSNPNVASNFYSTIKSVARDPFVVEAASNTVKFQQYQSQISKIREGKDKDLYSDVNNQDALEQSGFYKYMAGETNSIGSINYKDYVNVNKNLADRAKEYAKDMGFERYLGQDASNPYQYIDKYGKKVTQQEIYDYLKTTVDEKEKGQMQINARQTLGKLSDTEYINFAKEKTQNRLETLRSRLATVKAQVSTLPDSEKSQYDKSIADLQEAISNDDLKVKNNTFDKTEMYGVYADSLLKDVSSQYDIDVITKVDKDKLPFEIMKFDFDKMKFDTETQLKIREIEAKEAGNAIAQQASLGTSTSRPTIPEESDKTDLEKIQGETFRTAQAFDAYLANTLGEDYNNMTEAEKWDFKLNYNPKDPSVKGNSEQARALAQNFQTAQKSYSNIVSNAETSIKQTIQESYNDLRLGNANLENLKVTMPLTASTIKSNKNLDFKSLSKETQTGLLAEWAANNLQFNGSLEGDVRKVYEKVVDRNKNVLKRLDSAESNKISKVIAQSTQKENSSGFISTIFQGVGAGLGQLFKQRIDGGINGLEYIWDRAVYNEAVAEQNLEENLKVERADNLRYKQMASNAARGRLNMFSPSEDTNITELEPQDLAIRQGAPSMDIKRRFDNVNQALKSTIQSNANSYMPNITENKAYTFSTDNKDQKGVASALRAVVLNAGGDIPSTTNDFTVAREGNSFRVEFTTGGGEKARRVSVLAPSLPTEVASKIDTSQLNWSNSPLNPNILLETTVIKPITDPKSAVDKIKNVAENLPTLISNEAKSNLMRNPAQSPFASVQDYRKRVIDTYGNNFYEVNKQAIDNILMEDYVATPYTEGSKFYGQITYGQGETEYLDLQSTQKNDGLFYLNFMNAVDKIKTTRIENLKRNAR